MNGPRLIVPVLFALALVLILALLPEQSALGIIAVVGCLFSLVDWLTYTWALRVRDFHDAKANTERVKMAETIAKMTASQITALAQYVPTILVTAGEMGPLFALDLDDGKIPMNFVSEFVRQGNRQYLAPIGTYSDGTDERTWAQSLTAYLITLRYADPAVGNRPAKWRNYPGAMLALGLSDNQEGE